MAKRRASAESVSRGAAKATRGEARQDGRVNVPKAEQELLNQEHAWYVGRLQAAREQLLGLDDHLAVLTQRACHDLDEEELGLLKLQLDVVAKAHGVWRAVAKNSRAALGIVTRGMQEKASREAVAEKRNELEQLQAAFEEGA